MLLGSIHRPPKYFAFSSLRQASNFLLASVAAANLVVPNPSPRQSDWRESQARAANASKSEVEMPIRCHTFKVTLQMDSGLGAKLTITIYSPSIL
jgi:hypothetical protein